MEEKEILKFCLKKGILLDKEVLSLLSEALESESEMKVIEKIRENSQKKFITKNVFCENIKQVNQVFSTLSEDKKKKLETLKIKLGLELEISKESISLNQENSAIAKDSGINFSKGLDEENVKVKSLISCVNKKPEVEDFVKFFKSRLTKLRGILQTHANLKDLVSINKLSGNRHKVSIIGIVSSKKTTQNKNILLEVEDFTGKIRVLINQNRPGLYEKGEEITVDSVIGVVGAGNGEIIFAEDIIYPDSMIAERKRAPTEELAAFIGDVHYGSKLFMKENFIKFVEYLNDVSAPGSEASKIKYLFIVGDLVAGIGIYPEQEPDLEVKDLEKQFQGIAELLGKIRKDITIILSPGNHDGVRLMEPQPLFDKKYAAPLYSLNNAIITTNPAYATIACSKRFSGFDILTYHGYSYPYYVDKIPSLIKVDAINSPDKIMAYLLKNRHLSPTHSSVQYYPLEEDPFVIEKVPDIFVSGHIHKSAVSYYNNILMISCSAWESITAFQEKMGNKPDFCKVPIVNLKNRTVKILDFE